MSGHLKFWLTCMDPRLGIINISRANRFHIGGVALFADIVSLWRTLVANC